MDIDYSEINYLQDPKTQELQADYVQFLLSMTGPTVIDITGANTNSYRVIVTLLQGDEPSGLIAIHRWLTTRDESKLPHSNLRLIICSVEAASQKPIFTNRFISGSKDINRCFGKAGQHHSFQDDQQGCYERANLIEQAIREVQADMIIDLHNAKSPGPTFAISSTITTETLSIAAFFCQTLILSDLSLGSLMEQNFSCPLITIECGGSLDEQAHEVAYSGIKQLVQAGNIDYIHQAKNVEVIYRPLRLHLNKDVNLSYAQHDEGYSGVTLKDNIEYFNYGGAHQDEMIGWLDGNGIDNLLLFDKNGDNVINEYFYSRDNQLVCKRNIRIFKATTQKKAALNDCLFYLVKQNINDT